MNRLLQLTHHARTMKEVRFRLPVPALKKDKGTPPRPIKKERKTHDEKSSKDSKGL